MTMQYTVPWAVEQVVEMMGQSLSNLDEPTSDLSGKRVLAALNAEYMGLSTDAMAKGHPYLMKWVNVSVDDRGWVENFRWHSERGDLIGLHPRKSEDDIEPGRDEQRHFATFHQMGYGLSAVGNTEYDFDASGTIRVYNSRTRFFRLWYMRKPSPLIAGRADRAYEAIDFRSSRVYYGGEAHLNSSPTGFSDENISVWDKSPYVHPNTLPLHYNITLGASDYKIDQLDDARPSEPWDRTVAYVRYEQLEFDPFTYNRVGSEIVYPFFRFLLRSPRNGASFIPPRTALTGLTFSEFWRESTDGTSIRIGGSSTPMPYGDVGARWNPNLYPNGVCSWSIMPWFPSRFMEYLLYKTIFRFKRVSTHDRFVKEEVEWKMRFDQWLERFDQTSSPQTAVDPNTSRLTEGDSIGSFIHLRGR